MSAKKIIPKIIIAAFVLGFGGLCFLSGSINDPSGTLWSLFPPVVAIGLALITKEVYSSLFVGVFLGALLAGNFSFTKTLNHTLNDGIISAVVGNAGIFVFLVLLGVMVALVNMAGGSAAFGNWASKHVKTKVGASLATFVFGVLIFIDDYFNCLTVGAVMRPVTDKTKMSRSKLAYLIDATAAPVCMIAPISSWAAAVASNVPENQGIAYFVKAIPFNFYSLLTFVFIIAITLMKFDYGPMKLHEKNAENGDLFTGNKVTSDDEESVEAKGRIIDLILPVIVLIAVCVWALVYVGGINDGASFIKAFSDTDATVGLPLGGLITVVLTVIYFIARRLVSFKEAMSCIPKGFIAMVPAILILVLANALKNVTVLLNSDAFVEATLGNASTLQSFLPAIIFLIACFISFATGTSWGTFGILIPIVLAIYPLNSTSNLGIICMSACLAGAVCGDHCSPISDTTIMASAGAQCEHMNHVSTQLPYAITVAGVSFVGYVLAGFIHNWYIVFPITVALTIGTLFVIKTITKKT